MIEETEAEPELLRIESISVEGLFGLYDHTIPLNLEDRVTIIHGPNGVGKTKILEWVDSLFRLDINAFARVPFRRFTVSCTSGVVVEIESTTWPSATLHDATKETQRETEPDASTAFIVRGKDRAGLEHEFRVSFQAARLFEALSKTDEVVRTSVNTWYQLKSGKMLSTRQAIMAHALDKAFSMPKKIEPPAWFAGIAKEVDITIIETDRLAARASMEAIRRGQAKTSPPAVEACATDLRGVLREALAEYGSMSQGLDQTFAQKLIQYTVPVTDIGDLKQRMIALDETRDRYARLGLLEEGSVTHPFDVSAIDTLEGQKRTILAVYVENTEEKLASLSDLADRIEILLDAINEKFNNKHLSIDARRGMVARDDRGNGVELSALSSGEQHEIVLLFDLLFNSQPNTLVLIDEPELSLHITWQKRFLDDLLQIAKLVGIDALVATHSPFIIGEREDLMIPLEATPKHRKASP